MELKKLEASVIDDRGTILDILSDNPMEHATVITSKKGVVRGHHYHKETIQWVYVLSGRMTSLTQNEGEPVVSTPLIPGHLLRTDKNERHALLTLEDTVFLVFTRGPRGGENYEKDTYRLEKPLEDPGQ